MAAPRKSGGKSRRAAEGCPPPYEPDVPDPTTRADLMKYWVHVSLDDRTAQKLLWISEGGAKVARASDAVCPYPNRPERYEHSPQVLCKESLLGRRAYWEVEYGGWVVVGLVCRSAPRGPGGGPSGLGENDGSWGAGWSGSCYQAWHAGESVDIGLPRASTLGVYLDQPAGVLKFLLVDGRQVQLLHQFRVEVGEDVFPGFWIGANSFCLIRKEEP